MSTQSWQIPCPRCGWANSGALNKCAKCGQPLGARPGMLVAGQSLAAKGERPVSSKFAKPGGFVPRTIALIVDSAILGVVSLPIYGLWVSQLAPLQIEPGTNILAEIAQRQISLRVALLVLTMFYFAGSWAMLGATPGQMLLSLRVTDARAGGIGFFRALLRWFCFAIFGIFSVILVPISKQKRALHDILAGTWVIQVVDSPELVAAGKAAPAPGLPPPAPAPAVAPVPVAVAAAPIVAAAAAAPPLATPGPASYVPPPSARPDYAPPPTAVAPTDYAPPPMDFPPMLTPNPEPAPAHTPGEPAPDAGLYAPPPMMEAAPSAAPREVYSPVPGEINDRAVKAAELYTAVPAGDVTPPVAPAAPAPIEPAQQDASHPHAAGPSDSAELPPIEFPPMAPPKP